VKSIRDPECAELNHLVYACPLTGKNILEIGCGEGKLTRQYEGMPRKLIGIDPEISDLRIARQNKTTKNHQMFFIQAIGENLPFPSQTLDAVIFASSL
jgi:ubiquinone/menaquinone biosynthesis C-methylase UbiE